MLNLTWKSRLLLVLILIMGACFAFLGLDWDKGQHQHPDERFLTMVVTSLEWPASVAEYFDESTSPLNPRNTGYTSFVYGTLPTTLVKGVSILYSRTEFHEVYLVGRTLSALAFLVTILLIYFLAFQLERDVRVALLAAFLFAASVLPVQQAHFFTVDTLTMCFMAAAAFWLVKGHQSGRLHHFCWMGVFFGMALASKLSVASFAAVVLAVGISFWWRARANQPEQVSFWRAGWKVCCLLGPATVLGLLTFRICQPDAFSGPGFWGWLPSARWLENLGTARQLMNGEIDFPPGHQWTDRMPLWFPWRNMVVWGMGLPLGMVSWVGWCFAAWGLFRRRETQRLVPVLWVGILFLHQGTQWVMSMRYFLPIYPFLALFAAWWLIRLWDRAPKRVCSCRFAGWWVRLSPTLLRTSVALVPTATLFWCLAFSGIYVRPHTRLQATAWIYENIPSGSILANEHWDDALPLRVCPTEGMGKEFNLLQLTWFDEDTPEKLVESLNRLEQADYVILNSNRVYDSVARLPQRYPMTNKYYQALFDGSLGFEKVAEFNSYPSLFGFEFNDQGAEEAFSVYDHPRVQIFQKTAHFSQEDASELLGSVDWSAIERLTPRQATRLARAERWQWVHQGRQALLASRFTQSLVQTVSQFSGASAFAQVTSVGDRMSLFYTMTPRQTPTPTSTSTPTSTVTVTPTLTSTPTSTPTSTMTSTATATATSTMTATATATATSTTTSTATPTKLSGLIGDVNNDGMVDRSDLFYFSAGWYQSLEDYGPLHNLNLPDPTGSETIRQEMLIRLIQGWRENHHP